MQTIETEILPPPIVDSLAAPPRFNPKAWLGRHGPILILLLLTALGGAIRFTHLTHPSLWGDEAMVYMRICGKYTQLLDWLREDGFTPLLYEMMWAVTRHVKPTPFVLRLPAAISGTLMIPAMYFLARQLLARSTALLVAAITACSGFLIFYSRDAKMYSETWLFVTLTMACLFWWFRTGRITAWLGWIVAGCAAVGFHSSAFAVLSLSPVLLLTQRKMHWSMAVLWVLGAIIIVSGPLVYYTKFNRWNASIERSGWGASGLEWIDREYGNRSGPELVRCTGTAFLMGWSWPRWFDEVRIQSEDRIHPSYLLTTPRLCAELLASILIVGLIPWPLSQRAGANATDLSFEQEPQWRIVLWLGLWLVVPAYFFYCHSIEQFAAPTQWLNWIAELFPDRFLQFFARHHGAGYSLTIAAALALIALSIFYRDTRPKLALTVKWLLAVAAIFVACGIAYTVCSAASIRAQLVGRPWRSIWMPRYLGCLWPALAMLVATLIMRLPTRPIRIVTIIFLLAVNLSFGAARILGNTEPPVEQMALDVFQSQGASSPVRCYMNTSNGDGGPAQGNLDTFSGRYYLQMDRWKQPISPSQFIASLGDFQVHRFQPHSTIIQQTLKSLTAKRLVIWDELSWKYANVVDTLGPQLSGWKLVKENWYPVRVFWDWQEETNYHRREYQKK